MTDTIAAKPDRAAQVASQPERPPTPEGFQRSFYSLWAHEKPEDRIWETVPNEDLVDCIVEGTGRQDWRKLRPFDLLPDLDPRKGGTARKMLFVGEFLRIGCERIAGPQAIFERGGDFATVFFQFSGISLIETSFGIYEIYPGEELHIPAMVAHRTIGSANCRRMVFHAFEPAEARLDSAKAVTETRYTVTRVGDEPIEDVLPERVRPASGKIRERLSRWFDLPGEAFLFERTYDAMVGKAESGPAPTRMRVFDHFSSPPDSPKPPVRDALLWEGPHVRQRVYANPGRQPAPHRGYDEDEFWFQFNGNLRQETEHGIYTVSTGEVSMAEAGISHTSTSHPGALRVTTYTDRPIRMVVDPSEHLRESKWEVREDRIRGWSTNGR
jgi:mannose-6-phosphate isomerase-like protein (cupin superfamily)